MTFPICFLRFDAHEKNSASEANQHQDEKLKRFIHNIIKSSKNQR